MKINTRGGIRTCGLLLRRQALYPLSYAGKLEKDNGSPRECQRLGGVLICCDVSR